MSKTKNTGEKWVYPGTGIEYTGDLPEDLDDNLDSYFPLYKSSTELDTITFSDKKNRKITLQQVSEAVFKSRSEYAVWVYPGTAKKYKDRMPDDLGENLYDYSPVFGRRGGSFSDSLKTVTFRAGDQVITIEYATQVILKRRKEALERKGKKNPFINPQNFRYNNPQLSYNNAVVSVYPDSFYATGYFPYPTYVPVNSFDSHHPTSDYFFGNQGYTNSNPASDYEPFTPSGSYAAWQPYKHTQSTSNVEERKNNGFAEGANLIWVYPGTGIEYTGCLPDDLDDNFVNYSPTYDATRKLDTVTFSDKKNRNITLQQISRSVFKSRRGFAWVYSETAQTYKGQLPNDLGENLHAYSPVFGEKRGHFSDSLKTITFCVNDQIITLDYVSRYTLKQRERALERKNKKPSPGKKPIKSKERDKKCRGKRKKSPQPATPVEPFITLSNSISDNDLQLAHNDSKIIRHPDHFHENSLPDSEQSLGAPFVPSTLLSLSCSEDLLASLDSSMLLDPCVSSDFMEQSLHKFKYKEGLIGTHSNLERSNKVPNVTVKTVKPREEAGCKGPTFFNKEIKKKRRLGEEDDSLSLKNEQVYRFPSNQ